MVSWAVVKVPSLGISYEEAEYYGWKHSIHIAFWIVFWGIVKQEISDIDEAPDF